MGTVKNQISLYYRTKEKQIQNKSNLEDIKDNIKYSFENGLKDLHIILKDEIENMNNYDSEIDRTIFDFIAIYKYSYKETAKQLGLSTRKVRYKYTKITEKIVNNLQKSGIQGTDNTTGDSTGYNGFDPADVSVTNTDDDTAAFIVSAISGNTSEDGTTATFTVRLSTIPDGNVVITVASDDTTKGTVDKSYLIFTSSNWNVDQEVTVTGVDDIIVDGPVLYTIILALDAGNTGDTTGYALLNPDDVSVTNDDND